MNHRVLALAACLFTCASAVAEEGGHGHESIEAQLLRQAVAPHRAEGHIARNEHRHPVETLMFFGVRPDHTVVEISPGGSGWYTEILAPFLREHGTYYAASYDPEADSEYAQRNARRYADKLAAHPEIYDKVQVTVFAPPAKLAGAPAGSADVVVTFRNTHNWMRRGHAEAAYRAFYEMLRPGGVLGVVQHRAPAGSIVDPALGYLTEQSVIELARQAGFELLARSEINANPRDTADHPEGVWTLPPALRLGDTDREKYLAIGESDRMTLLFMRD